MSSLRCPNDVPQSLYLDFISRQKHKVIHSEQIETDLTEIGLKMTDFLTFLCTVSLHVGVRTKWRLVAIVIMENPYYGGFDF